MSTKEATQDNEGNPALSNSSEVLFGSRSPPFHGFSNPTNATVPSFSNLPLTLQVSLLAEQNNSLSASTEIPPLIVVDTNLPRSQDVESCIEAQSEAKLSKSERVTVLPNSETSLKKTEFDQKPRTQLVTKEDRAEGAVQLKVYKAYFKYMQDPIMIAFSVLAYVIANGAIIGQQLVVSWWSSDPTYQHRSLLFYSSGVALMAIFVAFFNFWRTYFSLVLGIHASINMHHSLLFRVLGAPIAFFDTTPLGRIIQRFSKDFDQVDQQLVQQFGMLVMCILQMFNSLVVILRATPVFVLGIIPVGKIYFKIMNFFRAVSRELKRLDAIGRSPIYSHFGETLGGLSSVRAFAHEHRFTVKNERLVDANMASYFALKVVDRWLNMRLETLGNMVTFSVATLAVYTVSRGHLSAGLAAFALTQSLSVAGLLNWAVRCLSETENIMNSVERIQYMATETKQEAPYVIPVPVTAVKTDLAIIPDEHFQQKGDDNTASSILSDKALIESGWPWQGQVTFQNVRMRYRQETELVLKGVNLVIKPGEKNWRGGAYRKR